MMRPPVSPALQSAGMEEGERDSEDRKWHGSEVRLVPMQVPADALAVHCQRMQGGKNAALLALQTLQRCAASAWLSIQGHRAMQKVECGWTQESKSSCVPQKKEERAAKLQPESHSFLQVQEEEDCYHE